MLHWRGGGRTIAHDPAALREIGYTFEERAAIHEHHGGCDREAAERLAWEHVEREWRGIPHKEGRDMRRVSKALPDGPAFTEPSGNTCSEE